MEFISKSNNKFFFYITALISSISILYIAGFLFFSNHFLVGSTVNGVNVSGKTVAQLNEALKLKTTTYTLKILERNNVTEYMDGKDIGLNFTPGDESQRIKNLQNPYTWVVNMFTRQTAVMTNSLTYNEDKLLAKINSLTCINGTITEPENPKLNYVNGEYKIISEIYGNRINENKLKAVIEANIIEESEALDLSTTDCYVMPQYHSDSKEVLKAKAQLNKYIKTVITLDYNGEKTIIDDKTISNLLTTDENYNVRVDENTLNELVDTLSSKFNTVGTMRNFKSTSGKIIKVSGGDYGWVLDKEALYKSIESSILTGKAINITPIFSQKANGSIANDIGTTYVEINISKQHLWFYKAGKLVTQGNIVTGNVSLNNGTPTGVYELKYKQLNAVLKGPGYSAPVSYWMPFNGGIGLHDANWRSSFGGKIYLTRGSHGCVNCPKGLAKTLYQNIAIGTPVVCYKS